MGEPIWLTYRDYADRLGLKPDAIRQRAKRQKLATMRRNDGVMLVEVDPDTLPPAAPSRPVQAPPDKADRPERPDGTPALVAALSSQISDLSAMLQRAEQDARQARTQAERSDNDRRHLQARADSLADRVAAMAVDLAQARSLAEYRGGDLARYQADLAKQAAELEALKAKLALPWWRRLFGQ